MIKEKKKNCVVCGKEFTYTCKPSRARDTCSNECRKVLVHTPEAKQKALETRKRNGTEYNSQSIKDKARATRIQKYGTYQDKKSYDQGKATRLEKYGYEHALQNPEFKAKRDATMLERYGEIHTVNVPELVKKQQQTNLKRYGVANPMQNKTISKKSSKTRNNNLPEIYHKVKEYSWWEENYIGKGVSLQYLMKKHGFGESFATMVTQKLGVPVINQVGTSATEKKLLDALKTALEGEEIITNTKQVISPKEIDIWLPRHNLAIEVNGLYWHSEITGRKDRFYHREKLDKCNEKGIRLLQFWDYEIESKLELCLNMILARIGQVNRVGARKCQIVFVSAQDAKEFHDTNHLAGYRACTKHIGLQYGDELMAVLSYGAGRYHKDSIEIVRYSNRMGYAVVGGFSKLLNTLPKDKVIVSYADMRYSCGEVYKKCGFELKSIGQPTPWYTKDYDRLYHRSKIIGMGNKDSGVSQVDAAFIAGYDRVYDAGQMTWVKSP